MNDYLSGIMALAQMTPEQFDLGKQRFETLRGLYGKNGFESSAAMAGSNMVTQGPTSISGAQEIQDQIAGQAIPNYSTQAPATYRNAEKIQSLSGSNPPEQVVTGGNMLYSQPTMTPTQGAEGGFGTGPTPYRQPYYQSSFVNQNPYFSGYGMGYNAYMPQFGRVGTYGSPGKGGGYGGGYSGGFGSYGKGGGI